MEEQYAYRVGIVKYGKCVTIRLRSIDTPTSGAYRHHPEKSQEVWKMDRAAGKRLRNYIETAMYRADIKTLSELARRGGIGRDTLQAWLRGERAPSSGPGARVAKALGGTYAEMLTAYTGQSDDPEPQQLIAAFEWAIAQVRAGYPPADVAADVARAQVESVRLRRRPRARPRASL